MSSIDKRVVEAKFDNKQFQEGVRSTLGSLDSLKKGLNLEGAARGLDNVSNATGRVTHGFSIMRIAAFTAISTITRQLVYMAEHVVASFTIDPIKEGFQNYETQINAVQTILANTGLKGKQGLAQVTGVLKDLNVYANQTVYNFSEMARNIGTFTAAGVKLKPAADSIKGIANLAAMSGSTSQQASTAMYQLSQAIAANQTKLQDWNSVVNAGMGGKVFQKALFDTGAALHTIKGVKLGETFDQWTKSGHTFRSSLHDGWINAKVLTTTLREFTGDMTDQQLKALGFNKQQIKAIQEQAKVAVEAATKIKTFTQLGQALKEEVGTAYASIFKTLFGDIGQAKNALSPLHIVLENFLTGPIYALNKVLESWAKIGGRTAAIKAFKDAWRDLGEVLKPIRDAFHEVFQSTYGMDVTLAKITFAIRDFFANFKIAGSTANELKRTFAGLFAIFDIGWQLIKQTAHFLVDLLSSAGHGSGGILKFTASLGDMLVKFDNAIKHGKGIRTFFLELETILKPVIGFIHTLTGHLGGLGGQTSSVFSKLASFLKNIGGDIKTVLAVMIKDIEQFFQHIDWNTVLGIMGVGIAGGFALMIKRLADRLKPKGEGEGGVFKGIIDAIKEPFEELTATLKQMQQTLRAATLLEIAAAVGILAVSVIALSHVNAANLAKSLAAIGGMFGELLGATALFSRIGGAKGLVSTATGLVVFATAIRILTSSVVKLSGLSWGEIAKGLVTTTALMAGLALASRGMSGQASGMLRTSTSMVILAAAIKLLASAVGDFAKMSWTNIAKGLTGVGAVLVALTLFTKFSDASKLGIARGAGLVLLAEGIRLLAGAVGDFGKMNWSIIGKGLASIGAILVEFAIFSRTVGNPVKMVAASASLVAIGLAMDILARVVDKMGHFSWTTIGKGLVTMGGALAIIVLALNAMPVTSVLSAAALMGVAVALVAIGGAMKIMGGMSWGAIAKSLVELAGALAIIAVAMDVMLTALPGAAALVVVAAALALLVPELAAMGQMSWEGIAKSLVLLAGALVVLGVAGDALLPAIPGLLGLGAAIALIGVGVGAAGAGLALMGVGLTAIAAAGGAAGAAIVAVLKGIISLIPEIAKAFGDAVSVLAEEIAKHGPALVTAMVTIFDSILNAARIELPKLVDTFVEVVSKILDRLNRDLPKLSNKFARLMIEIIDAVDKHSGKVINHFTTMVIDILGALTRNSGRFVNAAGNWVIAIINGISRNLGRIINAGTNLVIKFIQGIGAAGVRIANAALDTIVAFINGLSAAIRTHTPELQAAGKNLAYAIADGMTLGLASKVGDVAKAGENLAKGAYNSAKAWLKSLSPSKRFQELGHWVGQGFALGIIGSKQDVIAAWNQTRDLLRAAIDGAKQDISSYESKLKSAEKAHDPKQIREFTAALAQARREYSLSRTALDTLNSHRKDEEAHLERLGKRYDQYSQKLDIANQKLKDAIQIRNDYRNSVAQQYNVLPDITNTTNLQDYTKQTEMSIADLQTFIDTMAKLRKQGLSDIMYKELLAKGTAALPLAEEILAGGKDSIKSVNQLGSQMAKEAQALANQASTALYQAGVDSAQGLVNGLKKHRAEIAKEMRAIAHILVAELKKELKIHSPSEIFDDLGQFTGKGLANGLRKSVPEVQKATSHLGKNTIETMKASIRAMNEMIADQTNLQPTIKPVLDLSNVKRQAAGINSVLATKQLQLGSAYSAAANASAGYQANQTVISPTDPTLTTPDVTFIQNNNSPKALSSADIYRQTNNQLSRVKQTTIQLIGVKGAPKPNAYPTR